MKNNPNWLIVIAILAFGTSGLGFAYDIHKGILVPSKPSNKRRDRYFLIGLLSLAIILIVTDWL